MAPKYDAALTSLFVSSLRPTQTTSLFRPAKPSLHNGVKSQFPPPLQESPENLRESQNSKVDDSVPVKIIDSARVRNDRKRKRGAGNDGLETRYLQRLHREVLKDEAKRQKPNPSADVNPSANTELHEESGRLTEEGGGVVEEEEEELEELEEEEQGNLDEATNEPAADVDRIPQHETLGKTRDETELERASRTVFLGNVSNEAIKSRSAKKVLVDHLSSILATLPLADVSHKIVSFRFRSTAFSDTSRPRKAAFAKGELMDATTKSTNAYVVYSTKAAAREAARKLNGTMLLGRHLRVDEVAHPAKIDHRRCVFVGNLGFVDDESAINAANAEARDKRRSKVKPPADIEEGLWRQFSQAGPVESVRVVRDKVTRVGKGFAYVQFKDSTGVEKALSFDGKKFPPLLPRALRVIRAKKMNKTARHKSNDSKHMDACTRNLTDGIYRAKPSTDMMSLKGRSSRLLGRAASAQLRSSDRKDSSSSIKRTKTPQKVVFEGHRASSTPGKGLLGNSGLGRKRGKPKTRSSRRGAAFKAATRKKGQR